MQVAEQELRTVIEGTKFKCPICPIYQNVSASPSLDPDEIKQNLVAQLVRPVRWTQTIRNMIFDGANSFTEIGPGKVLQALIKKIDNTVKIQSV
ncbi:MAG: ACP S-malonyltransferase [Candidatus Komeilibacteria bacterium]|jgi:[acyl-carrier-protein] S-malonyltransferase|nr:ACP S-malonyltransferase [Candidatus Komeilibacteria bacterium]